MLVLAALLPAIWPRSVDRPASDAERRPGGARRHRRHRAALLGVAAHAASGLRRTARSEPRRHARHHRARDRAVPGAWQPVRHPSRAVGRAALVWTGALAAVRPAPRARHRSPHRDPRGTARRPGLLWSLAASLRAGSGDVARAAALACLGAALALNPDILRFHPIGHTQIYWPLLLVFAAALAGRRWIAAAICLGLLVAARTTMIALVPVFFLHLWTRGRPDSPPRPGVRARRHAPVRPVRRRRSRLGLLRDVRRVPEGDEGLRVVLDHVDAEHLRHHRPPARARARTLRRDHPGRRRSS